MDVTNTAMGMKKVALKKFGYLATNINSNLVYLETMPQAECYNCSKAVYRVVFSIPKYFSDSEVAEAKAECQRLFNEFPHEKGKWVDMGVVEYDFTCSVDSNNIDNNCKDFKKGKPKTIIGYDSQPSIMDLAYPKRCTICEYICYGIKNGKVKASCSINQVPEIKTDGYYCDRYTRKLSTTKR
jgi:hypothetical protein